MLAIITLRLEPWELIESSFTFSSRVSCLQGSGDASNDDTHVANGGLVSSTGEFGDWRAVALDVVRASWVGSQSSVERWMVCVVSGAVLRSLEE